MILENKTLEDIIKERKLTLGTILSHLEKLLEEKVLSQKDIAYLMPKTKEFKERLKAVQKASEKFDEFKLTPVFNALKGKYSFDEIRMARVFLV